MPVSPAVMLDAIRRERMRRDAERSLYEFVKQSWHVVEPGVPFVPGFHIESICEHLEAVTRGEIRRLLINIPPRHSKSTIVSVMWPIWEWITAPQQKYLCASYSGTLSIRDNLKARRLVQSPWYQERWGSRFALAGDQNAKQRFENDKTGYRLATSVGGTATGEGGSRLVLDDPHNAQEAQSDAVREAAIEWFDMVWSTRLNDPKKDVMVTIMQRLHENDVSGRILELGGWEHLCIPAEWDGVKRRTKLGEYDPRRIKGQLICPERFGPKELEALKVVLGSYGASGQLQQDPVPAEGRILDTRCFRLWPADQALPQFEYVLQSYDCAFTDDADNDPTAMTAWGIFTHKNKRNAMLLDAWDENLTYPQLRKRAIKEWTNEYGGTEKGGQPTRARRPDRALIEEKAAGISLIQDLRLARVPLTPYNPGKADKISRAHQSSPTLEIGLLWIPESSKHPGQAVSWAQEFIKQLSKFPVAKHDDYVDTFTQAVIYFKNERWFDLPTVKEDDAIPDDQPRINPYAA